MSRFLQASLLLHVLVIFPAVAQEAPATKTVFLGGTGPHLAALATAAVAGPLLAAGNVGLYEHGNGMAALDPAQRAGLWAAWQPTGVGASGQGQAVAEIGCPTLGGTGVYTSYFGGAYPNEVNMNCWTGSGDGTGSYTAGPADAHPGSVYPQFISPIDLVTFKSAVQEAERHGARNAAPFLSPNGGSEDLADPFATGAYWANARDAALYSGGLALDCPSGYFLARGSAYQSMIFQMIRWGVAHGIRVAFVVSPYAMKPDGSGNTGAAGFDPRFLEATEAVVAMLSAAGAMPTQFAVESYSPGGTANDIQADGADVESLNAVALYLAKSARTAPPGTAPAGANGVAEAGLEAGLKLRPGGCGSRC